MRVVNLPHTPAVYAQPINDNETYFTGLEVEVINSIFEWEF